MSKVTRCLNWYGVGLASADRLPVRVRIPAGLLGSLKYDPPKGNGRRPKKKNNDKISNEGEKSNKHIAETQDPPSQDPGDHNVQPFWHNFSPIHYEVNTDDAGSQRNGENWKGETGGENDLRWKAAVATALRAHSESA